MSLRWVLPLILCLFAGCVSSGGGDPTTTERGRNDARDAYIQLGSGYLHEGMTARAKVPLRKALELDPKSADAHAALALVFQTEMEVELADQEYRQALSYSDDARILNNYGSFLYEQGRYKEAFERFQQASKDPLYPERARVFENMGLTELKLGRTGDAENYFVRSLRLDNRRSSALLELATLSYNAKQYVPAKRYYDNFTELSEQNARSLLLGVHLADIFQERDKSANLVLRLKRLYPASPEYKTYLSEQR
ncbi:type IV pilus biogenesis/stability protein PilW [Azomonas macrocytogenes]|uniref:Type IV pilus assembly protein PilF n=1 Tax=Azomonas macrocytogenes TaxID=69962 RepID=A0A839T063_AZOMA|nr:type IV pilus biogenesis/stability protein PilW [Azomonas macrocytogenes]MBB3101896.1 type IV pilus assembly protein PilF [Azomonas macrocytogenes]